MYESRNVSDIVWYIGKITSGVCSDGMVTISARTKHILEKVGYREERPLR